MYSDTPFFIFQSLGVVAVLLFFALPVVMAVVLFVISSDIKKIKRHRTETDIMILSRLERIEKSLDGIRKSPNVNPAPPVPAAKQDACNDDGWVPGVTDAEKSEASVLMPRLSDMQGVIIKCIDSGGYDVWSRYSWEKFGNMDPGYRLIYKNYKE